MLTLTKPYFYQEEIKKSRFLARASPVDTVADALVFLEETRDNQANHNCWAYKTGDLYRFSDDGEPGGTAGKPIFNAIEKLQLNHVVVAVTRYFGGVKLGTGGLIRAYGGVAATCLREASKIQVFPTIEQTLQIDFNNIGQIHSLLEQFQIEKLNETYTDSGIILKISIKEFLVSDFTQKLTNACKGNVQLLNSGPD
ncbi:IMPACT family protein [bacterium]|nr:IMPACT family protein [bacterium]